MQQKGRSMVEILGVLAIEGNSECNSSNNITLKNIVPDGFLKKPLI